MGVGAGCCLVASSLESVAAGFGLLQKYDFLVDLVDLLGAVVLTAAFGLSRAGFVQSVRELRVRKLAIGARLFAVYGAVTLVSTVLLIREDPSGEPWKIHAVRAASVAQEAALVIAAVLVGVGVLSRRSGWVLGWACLVFALHFALLSIGYGFDISVAYDFGSPSTRLVFELIAGGTGYLIAGAGAVKAAIAFATGGPSRDRALGVAAILFAAGFLLATVARVSVLSSGVGVRTWANTAYLFLLAVAAAVGVKAFFSSEQRDSSDLAGLADPQ